jgi:hypothetical protein
LLQNAVAILVNVKAMNSAVSLSALPAKPLDALFATPQMRRHNGGNTTAIQQDG